MAFYKHSEDESLEKDLFENPTSEYRGAPFWAWNCKLDKSILAEQIEVFKKMGFGGFHIHSRTGMAEEYLGESFMNFVKFSVKKAKDKDMLTYLYDEDRYSSGYAGGYVTKNPKYRSKALYFSTREIPVYPMQEAYEQGKPYLVGVFDVRLNDDGELIGYNRVEKCQDCSGLKWYAYIKTSKTDAWFNNSTYVDTLSKEAIDEFVKITYDAYRDAVGGDFGMSIPSMFTDEPHSPAMIQMAYGKGNEEIKLPWTYSLPAEFEKKYGYDISDRLPEIIWNLADGSISEARYNYRDFVCGMFAENYLENCRNACHKNNLNFIGHIMAEENLECQTQWCGETMRAYKYFDFPGIDILCHSIGLNAAKQCQSVVHQYGKEAMTCELYGVTNWKFDFRGHKLEGDWLAALGTTLRVPHLSWVSMAGESKRDYPASIGYQSPWYEEYSYIENHFARINTALTRGKPQVRVAVIHPIESYWINYGPNDSTGEKRRQINQNFADLTEWLLFGSIDFDFVCESLLAEQTYFCADRQLGIGQMRYEAVIVPNCETLRSSTLNVLAEFAKCGGTIFIAGDEPRYIDAKKTDDYSVFNLFKHINYDRYDILNSLDAFRDVKIVNSDGTLCDNFIYNLRNDNGCMWLFIAHGKYPQCSEDVSPQNIKIIVRGRKTPVLYDTLSGKTNEIEFVYNNNNTVMNYCMYQNDSLLIKLENRETAPLCFKKLPDEVIKTINLFKRVNYERCEPNVLLLDRAQFALNCEEYDGEEEILKIDIICREKKCWPLRSESFAQPWTVPYEEPVDFVMLRFKISSEINVNNALLAVEDAEKLDITFNGIKIENYIVGYYVDHAIKTLKLTEIRQGENELIIKVPFGKRTNIEWCYILGDFNVRVNGTESVITESYKKIGFSDLTTQGMPFYGGNIIYKTEVETPECDMLIHTVNYRGSLVKIYVDGNECGVSAFAPYIVRANGIKSGRHIIEFKLFGTRINTFGGLHNITRPNWVNSGYWRTTGDNWCYEYNFWQNGILSAPRIDILEC